MKTKIITSKKNFEWISMQEIIPGIENLWLSLNDDNHEVSLINSDDESLFKSTKSFFDIDNIVITCFTVEAAKFVEFLRRDLGLSFRIYFYVHGMASVGLWPLYKWGLGNVLTENDVFVVTCRKDKNIIENLFVNKPLVQIIPFTNDSAVRNKSEYIPKELVYIGRISEQKNIHSLFPVLSLLREDFRELKLTIFGKEDHLGSPNMGKKSGDYLGFLKDLAKKLNLEDIIEFKGFVDRNTLSDYLYENDVELVSPSLHSDENFGMVVYEAIKNGVHCTLSDWGGFSDFKENFPTMVSYFDVYKSTKGPVLNQKEVYEVIKRSLQRSVVPPKDINSFKLSIDAIGEVLFTKKNEQIRLKIKDIVENLLVKREEYYQENIDKKNERNFGTQIFCSYEDPLANYFLNHYGDEREIYSEDLSELVLLPWCEIRNNTVFINDPHRGDCSYPLINGEVKLRQNSTLSICQYLAQDLAKLGYGYFADGK